MLQSKSFSTIVIILLIFLLNSCLTSPSNFEYKAEIDYTYETDFAQFTFTEIPENVLLDQFGKTGNVFIEYPGKLMKRKTIVFRLDVNDIKTPFKLDLRNIILTIDDVSSQSKYKSQLLDKWSTYIKKKPDEDRAIELTNRYMFPNSFTLSTENSVSGLIVFLKDFPEEGERVLTLNLELEDKTVEKILIPLVDS